MSRDDLGGGWLDQQDEPEIGEWLRAQIPLPAPDYWTGVRARLQAVEHGKSEDAEQNFIDRTVAKPPHARSSAPRILGVAAAFVLIAGLAVVGFLGRSDVDTTDVATGTLERSESAVVRPAATEYDEGEQILVDLMIAPSELSAQYRQTILQVDDPNGNARIDDRWYEPRLITEDCAYRTDVAPVPSVGASFVPGDPALSTTNSPFEAMQADHSVSIQIHLFDDSEQRDQFSAVVKEAYTYQSTWDCEFLASMFDADLVDAPDIGYPGFGVRDAGLVGASYQFQYDVGERTVLIASIGAPEQDEVDSGLLDEFLELQVAKLQRNGLG